MSASGYYFKCGVCDQLIPEPQLFSELKFYKKGHYRTRALLAGYYDLKFCDKCTDLVEAQIHILKNRQKN